MTRVNYNCLLEPYEVLRLLCLSLFDTLHFCQSFYLINLIIRYTFSERKQRHRRAPNESSEPCRTGSEEVSTKCTHIFYLFIRTIAVRKCSQYVFFMKMDIEITPSNPHPLALHPHLCLCSHSSIHPLPTTPPAAPSSPQSPLTS